MEKPPQLPQSIESISTSIDNDIRETRILLDEARAKIIETEQLIAEAKVKNEQSIREDEGLVTDLEKIDGVSEKLQKFKEDAKEWKQKRESFLEEMEAALQKTKGIVTSLEKTLADFYAMKLEFIDPGAKPN